MSINHDHPVPEFPTRPAELPYSLTLGELAQRVMDHCAPLVDDRFGLGPELPDATLRAHAVAALATQHALTERALYTRWVTAYDALARGATLEAVTDAMGLDADEVVAGLGGWADGQLGEGVLTVAEHAALLAVLGRAAL